MTVMTLEAGRVDATVALQKDCQGVLNQGRFLRQAFYLYENVLFVAPTARSSSTSNENATTRKRMRLPRVREFCHRSALTFHIEEAHPQKSRGSTAIEPSSSPPTNLWFAIHLKVALCSRSVSGRRDLSALPSDQGSMRVTRISTRSARSSIAKRAPRMVTNGGAAIGVRRQP
jgi:hypothetical protein